MSALFTESRIISVLVLLLAAGLTLSTFGLSFADLGGAFSPMFFPRIILGILLVLAALNMVLDLRRSAPATPIQLLPVVLIGAAFVAYVLLIVPLGFFLSSTGMGVVVLLALGLRNPLRVLGIPALASGALVLCFNHVLKMPLPSSPFFWWL